MLKPGLQSQPRIFIVNIIRKKIKRWLKDMNLMFSWYDKYLTGLLRSLVWYCFCHSNKKFTYSRRRVIPLSFRPVEQKSPKGRPFILLSFFFYGEGKKQNGSTYKKHCQLSDWKRIQHFNYKYVVPWKDLKTGSHVRSKSKCKRK